MTARFFLFCVLVLCGAGWGISVPLTKIAVSTGYQPFGLIFWQLVIGAGLTGLLLLRTGKPLARGIPQLRLWLMIALIGTVFPNSASYLAAAQLPAAVLSICLALIPLMAFPVALAMGNDRFSAAKLLGLVLGLLGVVVLSGGGPALLLGAPVWWLLVALIAPAFYAFEGNLVNRYGTAGLDPVETLFGASCLGAVIALPLALGSGQFISPIRPFAAPEWAFVGSSIAHVLVYTAYIWMVGRAGAVFAAQVSYLVTLFGLFWAVLLLGERIPPEIWIALVFTFAGLFLVQPKPTADPEKATTP